MRQIVGLGIAAVLCLVASCSHEKTTLRNRLKGSNESDGLKMLVSAVKEIGDAAKSDSAYSSSNRGAITNADFIYLYRNPYDYFSLTKKLMVLKNVDDFTKVWLIRTSQCLNPSDYLELGKIVHSALDDDLVSADVLKTLVSPGLDWGIPFVTQSSDAEARSFLYGLLEDNRLGHDTKATIKQILSGERRDFVMAQRRAGEKIPLVDCK